MSNPLGSIRFDSGEGTSPKNPFSLSTPPPAAAAASSNNSIGSNNSNTPFIIVGSNSNSNLNSNTRNSSTTAASRLASDESANISEPSSIATYQSTGADVNDNDWRNEDEIAEAFHQRMAAGKPPRQYGGSTNSSFWRNSTIEKTNTISSIDAPTLPSFASVNLAGKETLVTVSNNSVDYTSAPKNAVAADIAASLKETEKANGGGLYRESSSGMTSEPYVISSPIIPRTPVDNQRIDSQTSSSTSLSAATTNSQQQQRELQKKRDKQIQSDRRIKLDAQSDEVDVGHIVDVDTKSGSTTTLQDSFSNLHNITSTNFAEMSHGSSAERASSDHSTGSILYNKTPNAGSLWSKSSSLIFPTGVEASRHVNNEVDTAKNSVVNMKLDQCENSFNPFKKKKLMLNNLSLQAKDIPVQYLCGTSLGNSLHKLSLANNRLNSLPDKLVISLPMLKTLDLSQCELHVIPKRWNLPTLKYLNLSHNLLRDFPEEGTLIGLPELHDLNMYGNKVAEIIIPHSPVILSKLETLNLGYNDLHHLPENLDRLRSLKHLIVSNNYLEVVPMRICEMKNLTSIDVASNHIRLPPLETCERGICSMRRYYQCLQQDRQDEQSKTRTNDDVFKRTGKKKKAGHQKKRSYGAFILNLTKKTPSLSSSTRTQSEDILGPNALNLQDLSLEPPSTSSQRSTMSLPVRPASDLAPTSSFSQPNPFIHGGLPTKTLQLDLLNDPLIKQSFSTDTSEFPTTEMAVNDTLKVIFVGMALAGKTSMIRRLIEGYDAIIPTQDERTIGVDIYEWDPKKDKRFEHIDCRIDLQDPDLKQACGDVDVKLSVWDFAGQHVYHATHELFFSTRALYVLVWDMGVNNRKTFSQKDSARANHGTFEMEISDDEDDEGAFAAEEEAKRADRALEKDIDEKVQFWIDCIQSSAPGAAILPVASYDDYFKRESGERDARRRCAALKNQLLRHESRRLEGLQQRLQYLQDQGRADDPSAIRLQKLMHPSNRPKLILGDDDNSSIVRVSGALYTGFADLTEKILDIATGRYKIEERYPVFAGHVGARIPQMRLKVRETVRKMRKEYKVVEWNHLMSELKSDHDLTSIEDISDALHFLTNIGELSFFGGVMSDKPQNSQRHIQVDDSQMDSNSDLPRTLSDANSDDNENDNDDEEYADIDQTTLSVDVTSITIANTDDGSVSTVGNYMAGSLAQYVFLNPRWLVAAVACILRHDLERELNETRRKYASVLKGEKLTSLQLNCPVITSEDACMLWKDKKVTKIAAKKAEERSLGYTVTPFEFLQQLLVRFGVFVPIDLDVDIATLGGHEFAHLLDNQGLNDSQPILMPSSDRDLFQASTNHDLKFFFLPSLLGSNEPTDTWTYKTTDSWKTTICYSVLFPDGIAPGLMERVTASVLSSIYAVASKKEMYCKDMGGNTVATHEGKLKVKELLCWRSAFFIKVATVVESSDGEKRESSVEMFGYLADRDSHLCVGSDYMGAGMKRLLISGRGQVGDGGRKIWKGGFLLVCKSVRRILDTYGGLEYTYQSFCPECLLKRPVREASAWSLSMLRSAVQNGDTKIRCQHGHQVETRLVAGPVDTLRKQRDSTVLATISAEATASVQSILHAIVVVGLWDGKTQKVLRVGSGFIVDKKRGLIVTAAHTLMNIWGDKNYPFGEDYYGLRQGKVVIGVIPRDANGEYAAVFRYFAKIVTKDHAIDKGVCHVDACVLKITTRLENDVGGNGEGCGSQPERLLLNNPTALKRENLQSLKVTDRCELEEQVRILGYNQGGEGLLGPGERLNRYADFAKGYVCKSFTSAEDGNKLRDKFKPKSEIVVICPTIGGHSGGPCVNQQGEVIGILSRADPAENQRCYLSPTSVWRHLVKEAKKVI